MTKTIKTQLGELVVEFIESETGLAVWIQNGEGATMAAELECQGDIVDFVAAVNAWADGGAR